MTINDLKHELQQICYETHLGLDDAIKFSLLLELRELNRNLFNIELAICEFGGRR